MYIQFSQALKKNKEIFINYTNLDFCRWRDENTWMLAVRVTHLERPGRQHWHNQWNSSFAVSVHALHVWLPLQLSDDVVVGCITDDKEETGRELVVDFSLWWSKLILQENGSKNEPWNIFSLSWKLFSPDLLLFFESAVFLHLSNKL